MVRMAPIEHRSCSVRPDCPVSAACAPAREAPCEAIAHRHRAKLAICDSLELIADSLPGAIDRHLCLAIAADLVPLLREAQTYEEKVVFPVFATDEMRAASVRRLKSEHVEDEALAEDLTETLLDIGHGGAIANPEALGFMLRAFFEAMRRHIAFEREHVAPLLRTEAP